MAENMMQAMQSGSDAALQMQKNFGAAPYATESAASETQAASSVAKLQKLTADTKLAEALNEPEYERQVAQTLQGAYADPANKGKSPSEMTSIAANKLISLGGYKSAQAGLALEEKAAKMSQEETTARKEKLAEASQRLDVAKERIASASTPEDAMQIVAEASADPAMAMRFAPIAKMITSGAPLADVKTALMDIHSNFKERVDYEALKVKVAEEKRKEEKDATDKAAREKSEARLQAGLVNTEKRTEALIEQGNRRLDIMQEKVGAATGKNGKVYDKLEDKLNDPEYGANSGKIPTKEVTVARRITGDSAEVLMGAKQLMKLTNSGTRDTTGTTFSEVKGDGFLTAPSKAFTNATSDKDSAMYDSIMLPIVKNMVQFDNPDYRPTDASVNIALKTYKSGSGQPRAVQVEKLAELKNTYVNKAEAYLDANILNPQQANSLKKQILEIQKAIPWDVNDAIDFSRQPGKAKSFGEFLKAKGSSGKVASDSDIHAQADAILKGGK